MRQESSQQTFSIFQQIRAACTYPGNMVRLTAMSEYNRLKSIGKKPVVHKQDPYAGQKIMLIALYQKGALREDIAFVMKTARDQGFYVLAVNNLRLSDPTAIEDCCDMYVERYNFGRDFGSFQFGFCHVFSEKWADRCPRLLMINDSVFFSAERVAPFLADMMNSPIEALGATENYEINHHLGSFCIAISGSVLKNPKFQKYWRRYRLSDVRPVVIKRGEMGLSKTLKRCVSSADQFQALYDSVRYAALLESLSQEQLEHIVSLMRRCKLTPARRFSLIETLEAVENDLSMDVTEKVRLQIDAGGMSEAAHTRMPVATIEELVNSANARLVGQNRVDRDALIELIKSGLVDNFRQHSQIHQNSAVLVHMGLPIIKLDCVYRGILNTLDVNILLRLLRPQEGAELQRLLYSRPFGGDVLVGWKRSAFLRGLI